MLLLSVISSRLFLKLVLLSIFDKLLEKLIAVHLNNFISLNKILYKYQFGFSKNYSTTLAVIDVVDEIYERRNCFICIYLDLNKVFDTVNHDILLYKLYNYGIRGTVYDWFKCYLSNRFQYTIVNCLCY